MAGFQDYDSYNQSTNPIYVLEKKIEIPLLVLNAEDDPVCHIRNFEPYKSVVSQMRSVAVVTTKKHHPKSARSSLRRYAAFTIAPQNPEV